MNKSKWLMNFRNSFITHPDLILNNKKARDILIEGVSKMTPMYMINKEGLNELRDS